MALLDSNVWDGKINIGKWAESTGGVREVMEPATGGTLGTVGVASRQDVLRAAALAVEAQADWASRKPEERAAVLRRAGQLWEEHAAEVQDWLIREAGSIGAKAEVETHIAANECYEASALPSHPHGEVLTSDEDRWSFARRRPAGVVGVIAPFNYPLILSIRSVAPALALGNAVLLKPDPRTAVSGGVALVRIFEEAGLPEGLLSLLPGDAAVGAEVIEAPEVRIVSFTGSTAAGRKVGALAARLLKRVHLELGGNSALVVLPGAELSKAASAGAFGSFLHQGQICMTTGRHFVHESLYDDYVAELSAKAENLPVGDPASGQVALGPVIDEHQRDKIDGIVQDAVAQGGRLTAGGTYEALFYRPTVLADLELGNPAFSEEIFGPVAPVTRFSTLDDVVGMVNQNEYGLSVGILGDVGTAMTIADRVRSGKVHINEQTVSDEANAPFGGVGVSGTGSRFGGPTANIEAFTEVQWLTMRPDIPQYPF